MKRFILLKPEEISHVHDKLIGSRLACAEIEWKTAEDIEKAAKQAVSEGRGCADLTEIFSRTPERPEGRNCEYILVKNEVLIDELTSRVFNVIAEYNDTVVITARWNLTEKANITF